MNKLIIDVANEKIFLMIITKDDIYNITNDNTGDVIINQNLFVANDICSNRVITYTNDDFAAQSYNEFVYNFRFIKACYNYRNH